MISGSGALAAPATEVHGAAVPSGSAGGAVLDAVTDLRRDVEATRLPLPLEGVGRAAEVRTRLVDQLDDHLLPRLRELSSPAVVVLAGSTGAGKSTVLNSLLGEEVSAAGVLRPTTRQPVLVHHPADAELLVDHPLRDVVRVVEHEAVPRGLALVDAPDLDSLLASNRAMAHRLLEAADLWVFLTTAARYGDALPWEVLTHAAERGTAMAMVLNRVPAEALTTVRSDLMARLREHGMAAVPLFLVPDVGPHEGLLQPAAVAPLRRWLAMVAGPDRARSVILRTQRGALRSLQPWVAELADAVQAQVDARVELEAAVRAAVEAPAARAAASVTRGSVVAGPVRARWESLTARRGPLAGRWRGRRGRARRVAALEELAGDLRASVTVALTGARRAGEHALEDALREEEPPGAAVVPTHGEVGPALAVAPGESAGDWARAAVTAVRHRSLAGGTAQGRPARRLVRAIGEEGAATVAALAAAGLGAAEVTLARALGRDGARSLTEELRADLGERAAEQARAAAAPAVAFLAAPELADDAASVLRLRLAVLKGLR